MTKRGKPSPAAKARRPKLNKQRKKDLKKEGAAPTLASASAPPAPAPPPVVEPPIAAPLAAAPPATVVAPPKAPEMAEPATENRLDESAQLVVAATEALEAAFTHTPTCASTDVSALELVTRERDQLKLEIVKLEQELRHQCWQTLLYE